MAGEAVFILPFALARIFRTTFLSVFDLTNFELGLCQSVYGFIAFLSYPLGGFLADKFPPRKLMAVALWLTALGGIYMATIPSYSMLKILFGYWGFTTIFLFWAALIKATRIWGGDTSQGKAFGFLDGGRGLVAALFGVLGVYIFSLFVDPELTATTQLQREEAIQYVILVSSGVVILIGILTYFFLKLSNAEDEVISKEVFSLARIKEVLRIPAVWYLMIIILCAYVGYKATGIFSQYARQVMLYNEVDSAKTGTYLFFIRPIVGVVIGFLADKSKASLYLTSGFVVTLIGSALFGTGLIGPGMNFYFLFSLFITAFGIYSARVLYFAVMKEGHIPIAITGTAVGIISFIGYTPDIFAPAAMGYLLDGSPGITGHRHVFLMIAAFSAVGFIASFLFFRLTKRNKTV